MSVVYMTQPVFVVTAAGVVPCVNPKMSHRTSFIGQIIGPYRSIRIF